MKIPAIVRAVWIAVSLATAVWMVTEARAQQKPGVGSDPPAFTHRNAPLGITIAEFIRKFPGCHASREDGLPEIFPPLTGYAPIFDDLLPEYEGQHLRASGPTAADFPDEDFGTLGNYFTFYEVKCQGWERRQRNLPDNAIVDLPDYELAVFQKKIAVISKDQTNEALKSGEDASGLMQDLAAHLEGQKSPIHEARQPAQAVSASGQFQADSVYVVYSDDGAVRTVIETIDAHNVIGETYPELYIGYVAIPIWREYSMVVESTLRSSTENTKQHREEIRREL